MTERHEPVADDSVAPRTEEEPVTAREEPVAPRAEGPVATRAEEPAAAPDTTTDASTAVTYRRRPGLSRLTRR